MKDPEHVLLDVAATQRQVFTRAQARAAGISQSGLARRLASGRFVPVGTHTLTFAGVRLDWRGQLRAGLLDLGPGALVSAEAAAALHGLDGYADGPLTFLVQRSRRRRTTLGEVTSAARIGPLDRCTIDGLPTTSGTRTLIELIGRASERELGNAVDSAIRGRLTTPDILQDRLAELGRQGRAGLAAFDAVMALAGVESWLERKFLQLLDSNGLPRPQLQRTYRRGGEHVARVDFDFTPLPVVVEVGGRRGYMSGAERRRQERRRNELQLLGKIVYFFTTEVVAHSPAYVVRTLQSCLDQPVGDLSIRPRHAECRNPVVSVPDSNTEPDGTPHRLPTVQRRETPR